MNHRINEVENNKKQQTSEIDVSNDVKDSNDKELSEDNNIEGSSKEPLESQFEQNSVSAAQDKELNSEDDNQEPMNFTDFEAISKAEVASFILLNVSTKLPS